MKYTHETPSATTAKMTITLDEKDLAPFKEQALKSLAKKVKISGFREGKIPVSVAEKHLDPNAVQSEVLDLAVNRSFIDAIIESKLQPLGRPEVNISKFAPYTELEFMASFEIVPEIVLADYRKMSKPAPKAEVTAAEVNEVIERLRTQMAEKEEVDRVANDGDEVMIDFAGKDAEGKEVQGATGTDYPLALGSKTFIDGFEENIIGMKPGEQKEFTLTFPKDYGHAPLANKKVTFSVTLKNVKEVKKPKVDDEFAKKVAQLDTLEELKKDIKKELQQQATQQKRQELKNQIVEELAEKSEVPLPNILIQDQEQAVRQDMIQNLSYRGQSLEDYLKEHKITEEEWVKKEVTPIAEKRVKTGLILSKIADQENIEASDEEVAQQVASTKERFQDPAMQAQLDTPEAQRDTKSRITTEKTLEYLIATITAKKK